MPSLKAYSLGLQQYEDGRDMKLVGVVECAYNERHWMHHFPHPNGDRLVCHICHPPAAILAQARATATSVTCVSG